jgi:hypothetical protein
VPPARSFCCGYPGAGLAAFLSQCACATSDGLNSGNAVAIAASGADYKSIRWCRGMALIPL